MFNTHGCSLKSFAQQGFVFLLISSLIGLLSPAQTVRGAPQYTFTVNNSGDAPDDDPADYICLTADGHCTLRAAIQQANFMLTTHNTILFSSAVIVIGPGSELPALTNNDGVTIYADHPVYLSGTNVAGDGLTLASDNNVVMGLMIFGFDNGLVVTGDNNVIGTDDDGVNDANERNVIYNNQCTGCTGYGIQLAGTNNVVAGNYIGTSDGASPAPNKIGIFVAGDNNRIGTDGDNTSDYLERNIISGNAVHGIDIEGANTAVAGNYIGLTKDGDEAQPNGSSGVAIDVLAAQTRIGTDSNGYGDTAERNIISGNGSNGVTNQGDYTTVAGNYIGTNVAGTGAIPNGGYGVVVTYSSYDAVIGANGDGTRDSIEGNTISGNASGGVGVTNNNQGTRIAGNKIGTNPTGSTALANQGDGIYAEGTGDDLLIGTNGDGVGDFYERNIISSNGQNGVHLTTGLSNAVIAGNYIGTTTQGTTALGNGVNGVLIAGGANHNRVGIAFDYPVKTMERNLISGNAQSGVRIEGDGSDTNHVSGNYIGTNASGNSALGNHYGVRVDDQAYLTIIGEGSEAFGNVISGNTVDGIYIGTDCASTSIWGNIIGLNSSQTAALGNVIYGIVLTDGAFDSDIQENIIAENGYAGIYLSATAGSGNTHSDNRIYENGGLGVDLAPLGVNPNDPGDADSGPNDRMNYPEFTRLVTDGSGILVEGFLDSEPNQAFAISFITVENCDPSGYGEGIAEGSQYGTEGVHTDASGIAVFATQLSFYSPDRPYLVMTTQYSEFSECKLIETDPNTGIAQLSIADASMAEGDSGSTFMDFEVSLDRTASITVSVHYAMSDGTAIAGQDYTLSNGTITFPPGTTQQTLSIEILGDTQAEPHETFQVRIYSAVGAEIQDAYATGTILDDDGGGGYYLFLPIVIR